MKSFVYPLVVSLLMMSLAFRSCAQSPRRLSWSDILSQPVPTPGQRLPYGPDSVAQFGELRLPPGRGPFPVVVVLHGGCWLAQYDAHSMSALCAALTQAGYATWNLEYRRLGNAGGGWPGTFQDAALGLDYVRELARQYPVSAKNVVVLGHSAGGQLALWLAARPHLPRSSPLYTPAPLRPRGVVALAGIPDLAAYAEGFGSCNAAVAELLGGAPAEVPQRYAAASPAQLLPLRTPVRLVQGEQDPIVPVAQARQFAAAAQAKGDDAQVLLLPDLGHFDLIAPASPAWPTVARAVRELLPLPKPAKKRTAPAPAVAP